MKVALVTGPCPPGQCGVGDYTACLSHALNDRGVEARIITSGNWSLLAVRSVSRFLREQRFDIVHIQHPTVGFGRKLGAQGLALVRRCVITIHEASQWHIMRKLSLLPFTFRPEHVIFTSTFERRFATRVAPWLARRSSVIPVGSNIRIGAQERTRTTNEILYFGLIVPKKEIEAVLEFGSLIRAGRLPLTIRVIGYSPARHSAYLRDLRLKAAGLPIIFDLNLSEEEIAAKLTSATIAYLPYADGASERRTTLKAALLSGMAVVTTRSSYTPSDLSRAVRFCRDPREALDIIQSLLEDRSAGEIRRMSLEAVEYGKQFSWEHIARLHAELYEVVLNQRCSGTATQGWAGHVPDSPLLP